MAAAAETTVARVANPAEQAMLAVAYATMEGNEARNESVEVITRELATFPARFQSVMDRIELMSEQMAALKEENAALRGRCEALESARVAEREEMQSQIEAFKEKTKRHFEHTDKVAQAAFASEFRLSCLHSIGGPMHAMGPIRGIGLSSLAFEE